MWKIRIDVEASLAARQGSSRRVSASNEGIFFSLFFCCIFFFFKKANFEKTFFSLDFKHGEGKRMLKEELRSCKCILGL